MSRLKSVGGLALSLLLAVPPGAFASSHREAPITALDHAADIADFYAFVSYDHPGLRYVHPERRSIFAAE